MTPKCTNLLIFLVYHFIDFLLFPFILPPRCALFLGSKAGKVPSRTDQGEPVTKIEESNITTFWTDQGEPVTKIEESNIITFWTDQGEPVTRI